MIHCLFLSSFFALAWGIIASFIPSRVITILFFFQSLSMYLPYNWIKEKLEVVVEWLMTWQIESLKINKNVIWASAWHVYPKTLHRLGLQDGATSLSFWWWLNFIKVIIMYFKCKHLLTSNEHWIMPNEKDVGN